MDELEKKIKQIIKYHGFYSNEFSGFSCYIKDSEQYPKTEGLLLWNYSKRYNKIETQIQKYHSINRIRRIKDMLGISFEEYKKEINKRIEDYINDLINTSLFYPIGNGVNLFGEKTIYNVAANLTQFKDIPANITILEKLTIKNPIVSFAEKMKYFDCKNKDVLISK